MHKVVILMFVSLLCNYGFAQQLEMVPTNTIPPIETDSLESDKKWDIAVDLASRYIWRGQSWGGNYFVVQPSFNYAVTNKLSIGLWTTTNFNSEDFEIDQSTPKGYQEFDIGLSYCLTEFLTVEVWDYYWPSLQQNEDVDRSYSNYGSDGVKTVDASLVFDFSDGYQYAFDATISTLIGGNDFRAKGDNLRRNYTTYIEAGYTFYDIFAGIPSTWVKNIDFHPVIGAVLNNEAAYYTYASYSQASVVNLGFSASREFAIGDGITMPFTLNYTHNAAAINTEPFGRNFLTAGLSFYY